MNNYRVFDTGNDAYISPTFFTGFYIDIAYGRLLLVKTRFYRFQVTSNLAVTPDIQYIRDPALNPSETDLWVFGMRARVTF